jgi:hypothetical protein
MRSLVVVVAQPSGQVGFKCAARSLNTARWSEVRRDAEAVAPAPLDARASLVEPLLALRRRQRCPSLRCRLEK